MIPASILLILLVAADAISHIALWMRERHNDERAQDMVHEAMKAELGAQVKVSDYDRDMSDLRYEIKRLRAFTRIPDDYKF